MKTMDSDNLALFPAGIVCEGLFAELDIDILAPIFPMDFKNVVAMWLVDFVFLRTNGHV